MSPGLREIADYYGRGTRILMADAPFAEGNWPGLFLCEQRYRALPYLFQAAL